MSQVSHRLTTQTPADLTLKTKVFMRIITTKNKIKMDKNLRDEWRKETPLCMENATSTGSSHCFAVKSGRGKCSKSYSGNLPEITCFLDAHED